MIGSEIEGIFAIFGVIAGITLFVLALVFVAVPLFKGIGWSISAVFRGIGWLIMHIFEFVSGTLGDILRFIGSVLVMLILIPLVPLNIVIGRWSAAGHFAEGFKRELSVGSACVYRAVLRRPLKLLLLDGMLEGLEQRLPEAMAGAPGADKPSPRTGQFDGYAIVGSLKAGGSGAKLYVAEPEAEKRRKIVNMPERVVIKTFALTEGSSLPQIVRESRALECAKQLGHVLDHGMDEHRFFYVMPYHPGEHLGVLTRQFHAECGSRGLDRRRLHDVMSYSRDLLSTLSAYHKGGLWHKDVKPENVIVHDGRAHLVDLGLVTPLRSAMTLTTHGTEYFRDPEMVRQALRGVKVHQVDGAKFDIYAVGAVLYFMIENTFPAHGGLSRVTQPSPDALRWIIRRAMTEYHQRYATADEMLGDVDFVLAASDPFAIKPAELPSMGGAATAAGPAAATSMPPREPAVKDHVAAAMSAAGAAVASAMSAVGAALGGANAGAGAAAGAAAAGAGTAAGGVAARAGSSVAGGAPTLPPKIVVTNWWTGAYRVEDNAAPAGAAFASMNAAAGDAQARDFRRNASAFRDQADNWRERVRSGSLSARQAAKEQIRAARARAKEMRAKAAAHRQRVTGAHSSGSPWLMVVGFITLALLVGGLVVGFASLRNRAVYSRTTVNGNTTTTVTSSTLMRPVLLVVDGADTSNPKVKQRLDRIISERREKQYDVITDLADDAHLRMLINQWWEDQAGPADQELEDIMQAHNAYGILHVRIKGDARRPVKDVSEQLVYSTRPDAASRQRLAVETFVPAGPAPVLPYLVINDHPAKIDPKVEAVVAQVLVAYRDRGWTLQTGDDVEAEIRRHLPTGKIETADALPPMLRHVLESHGLGGVLRIDAMPGNGSPQERVMVTIVKAEDMPALTEIPEAEQAIDAPEAPSVPPAPESTGEAAAAVGGCAMIQPRWRLAA